MTRRHGQITRTQALLGLVLLVAMVAGMVALMDFLLPPQDPATVRRAEELAQAARGRALEEPQPGVPVCPRPGTPLPGTSSQLLYECPRVFDGREVVYTGEVVGEVLHRDGYAWVQLNDDAYALALGPLPSHGVAAGANSGIGVAIPSEDARRIEHVGGHETQGDVLTVRGVFQRTDPADGGGTTIRADAVLRRVPGGRVGALAHPGRRIAALVLLAVTVSVVSFVFREPLTERLRTLGGAPRMRRLVRGLTRSVR